MFNRNNIRRAHRLTKERMFANPGCVTPYGVVTMASTAAYMLRNGDIVSTNFEPEQWWHPVDLWWRTLVYRFRYDFGMAIPDWEPISRHLRRIVSINSPTEITLDAPVPPLHKAYTVEEI